MSRLVTALAALQSLQNFVDCIEAIGGVDCDPHSGEEKFPFEDDGDGWTDLINAYGDAVQTLGVPALLTDDYIRFKIDEAYEDGGVVAVREVLNDRRWRSRDEVATTRAAALAAASGDDCDPAVVTEIAIGLRAGPTGP